MQPMSLAPALALTAGLAVFTGGCASKKYVNKTTAPIEERLGEVDAETAENRSRIDGLETRVDRDVNRLDERTRGAVAEAGDALSAAQRAQDSANEAAGMASEAKTFAGAGLDRLERTMIDLTQYRQVRSESILFGFDSANLSQEAMGQLDALASEIGNRSRYVIELRGFSDSVGDPTYNLRLSERRAEAVARHLIVNHDIPLRYIHSLGLGEAARLAGSSARDDRTQNRRVEVTLYTPIADAGMQVTQQ